MTIGATSTAATVTVRINDEPRTFAASVTVDELVRGLGFTGLKGIAIAINDSVVTRGAWSTRSLVEGDRVLVIRATQGG